jgi:pyroglutamyl-peptidase
MRVAPIPLVLGVLVAALLLGLWLAAGRPARPRVLLLTGFGPFPGYPVNPSWEAARRLEGHAVGGLLVRTARLDVAYARAADQLLGAIARTRPDAVLCLGVAPGTRMRVERVARNRDTSPAADVDGRVGGDRAIHPGGPTAIPTRLPARAVLEALSEAGFNACLSDDAGGYLCNHVFYVALDETPASVPAGFVHVPPLGAPWTVERLVCAVETVVETIGGAETTAGS